MASQDEQWLLKEKYGGEKSEGFFTDCERLAAGVPLAYIIGSIPFLNCKIYLDSHPLIPRPETEFWVEQFVGTAKRNPRQDSQGFPLAGLDVPVRVLDLCAGSGCIGVAVAKALPGTLVDFAELDARHLPTIQKNIEANGIDVDTTNVFQSDLFANVSNKYDIILSNPPYVDPAVDRVEPSVREHEPHHALYGGAEGLELIAHIIVTAQQFLNKNGQLWLEHEPEQVEAINKFSAQAGFKTSTHTDQYSVERYSVLRVA